METIEEAGKIVTRGYFMWLMRMQMIADFGKIDIDVDAINAMRQKDAERHERFIKRMADIQ